jgi:regulatory protein
MTAREGDGGVRLAPVTYLPGAEPTVERVQEPVRWAIPLESNVDDAATPSTVDEDDDGDGAAGSSAEGAEEALTRRLRRSALSERESRTFLAQRGFDAGVVDAVIDRFTTRGWIDDAVLAEQLLYAGTSRKGQGRRAIAQTLTARGIARDVADAALATLPDDDDDRALEYARSKAHGLRSYDLDTAMRRLMGQLARRGYSGSVASNAARTALTEQRGSGGGVQFR